MLKTVKFITANFDKYDPHFIDQYEEIGGFNALKRAVKMDGEEIASEIALCGVKGRGGAAYDMGRKWSQAKAVDSPKKVVICNADEGEPCTFKDRSIITKDPFRLIEGLIIAGYAINAQNGYIYMREEYTHLRPLLLNAIEQAKQKGYLGKNILGIKGFNYDIHLYSGAGAYVCGEGTALIESIEGKAGRPRMKPPFIKQSGLYKLPTLVNNVESLTIVPAILMDQEKKYLKYGTEGSIGTKLISVGGNVKKPGVYEIPFGVTLRDIIYGLAGGIVEDRKISLIQLGGASGKITSSDFLDTKYTYDDLKAANLTVGSGAVLVIDERTSVIDFLRYTQNFFSHESCGQCTPCREGNRHIRMLLERVKRKQHTYKDLDSLTKFADIMCSASLCGLGETAQNALICAMKLFPKEFEVIEGRMF